MKIRQIIVITLLTSATATAAVAPTRFFYRDQGAVSISLDEPATGCRMNGQLLHPVEKPAARVLWFSERVCGSETEPVSLVSGEIIAPDNVIHRGDEMRVQPVKVRIVEGGIL